jgi:hypothetical protein
MLESLINEVDNDASSGFIVRNTREEDILRIVDLQKESFPYMLVYDMRLQLMK